AAFPPTGRPVRGCRRRPAARGSPRGTWELPSFAACLATGRRKARGSSPSLQASRPLRLPQARLDQVLDRFREIEARMGAATDGQEIVRLGKEHAELKPVVDAVEALERVRAEAPELEEMAAADDPDMAAMARDELEAPKAR